MGLSVSVLPEFQLALAMLTVMGLASVPVVLPSMTTQSRSGVMCIVTSAGGP